MTVLVSLLLIAGVGARVTYGETFFSWQRFSGAFFFMGAAFLLIETRGVTNLSLLFGSTSIVNSAVFAGILTAALAANLLVTRLAIRSVTPLFVVLAAALAVNYFVPPGAFLRFSPGVGGVLAALVNGVPVGIAGILFSYLLARAPDPAAALGWNLLGAVVGGSLARIPVDGLRPARTDPHRRRVVRARVSRRARWRHVRRYAAAIVAGPRHALVPVWIDPARACPYVVEDMTFARPRGRHVEPGLIIETPDRGRMHPIPPTTGEDG